MQEEVKDVIVIFVYLSIQLCVYILYVLGEYTIEKETTDVNTHVYIIFRHQTLVQHQL